MRLGFITNLSAEQFDFAAKEGFVLEFNANDPDLSGFLGRVPQIKADLQVRGLELTALGRFGRQRIHLDSDQARKEADDALRLMDAGAELGVKTLVLGLGEGSGDLAKDCQAGVRVLTPLLEKAQSLGLGLALYNCRWGNFACRPEAWEQILPSLPGLGIKYDPSHAFYEDQDVLAETLGWGKKFLHFHLKGGLKVGGRQVEDPPAGLDQIPWGPLMALLIHHGYSGDLVIEPHAQTWMGERFYQGVQITAGIFRQLGITHNPGTGRNC